MNTLLIHIIFVLHSLFAYVSGYPQNDILVRAIVQIESRGDACAHNVSEDAVGVLQIRPIMVNEVNRLLGKDSFTLEDRWDVSKSIAMFEVIKSHTNNPTNEVLARNWNGGWSGYKKKSTLLYWQKVKKEILRLENIDR
jgi:hypothetical protein